MRSDARSFSVIVKFITAAAVGIIMFFCAELTASADSWKAALSDLDECLTSSEESKILSRMQKVADKVDFNLGIVITDDLGPYVDEGYADMFGYDNFGDTDWAVLLLLNTHSNPEYAYYEDIIALNGRAHDVIYENVDIIFDKVYNRLEKSSGYDFYGGCIGFVNGIKAYGTFGVSGFINRLGDFTLEHPVIFLVTLVICGLIGFFNVKGFESGYKKKKPVSASGYIERGRTRIITRQDIFLREFTTSCHTGSSSGSSTGGSSGGGGGSHSSSHSSSHGHHR